MSISEKKQNILKAAGECFARYGYEKTTMDDIGKLVGLNKASLYYYYKNKEAIFSEIIFLETQKFFTYLKDTITAIEGCREKITTYLIERLDYFKKTINLHKLSLETTMQFQPLFKDLLKTFCEKEIAFISEIITCCIENNEIRSCDTMRVAQAIISVAEGIKLRHVNNCDNCFDVEAINYAEIKDEVKFTISLILDGLKK